MGMGNMEIDRRAFIASLGGMAVVDAMDSETKAEALEHYMVEKIDEALGGHVELANAQGSRRFDLIGGGADAARLPRWRQLIEGFARPCRRTTRDFAKQDFTGLGAEKSRRKCQWLGSIGVWQAKRFSGADDGFDRRRCAVCAAGDNRRQFCAARAHHLLDLTAKSFMARLWAHHGVWAERVFKRQEAIWITRKIVDPHRPIASAHSRGADPASKRGRARIFALGQLRAGGNSGAGHHRKSLAHQQRRATKPQPRRRCSPQAQAN